MHSPLPNSFDASLNCEFVRVNWQFARDRKTEANYEACTCEKSSAESFVERIAPCEIDRILAIEVLKRARVLVSINNMG